MRQRERMFRRNLFNRGPKPSSDGGKSLPVSPDTTLPPVPEDRASDIPTTPLTPIPQRPALYTSDSWNDPPASWTSAAAAYDINSKYTTANQSYTHRRRKSSVLTGLLTGQADQYAPTYRDWRDSVSTPPGIDAYSSHQRGRKGKVIKTLTIILLVISLVLSGFWIYGGAMPLKELSNPLGGTFAGDIWRPNLESLKGSMGKVKGKVPNWETWKYQHNVRKNWEMIQENVRKNRDLKYRVKEMLRRGLESVNLRRVADPRNNQPAVVETVVATSTGSSTVGINSDMLKAFGAQSLATVTRTATETSSVADEVATTSEMPSLTVVISEEVAAATEPATVLGAPVMVRDEPTEVEESISTEPSATADDSDDEDDIAQAAHKKRMEELWRKHGDGASEEGGEKLSSFAGTLADGVSPSTET